MRRVSERIGVHVLRVACILASSVIVFIAIAIIVGALPILTSRGLELFSRTWDPNSGKYGILPFIAGSLFVVGVALMIAIPIGVLSALFVVEYSPRKIREFLESLFQVNFSIPSVIYGFWALVFIVPLLRESIQPFLSSTLGFIPLFSGKPRGFGVMAAGLVLAIMITPLIVAISIEVMKLVPEELKLSAYAIGASKTEVAFKITLRVAFPGIAAAILLSLGRAIGETMAVLWVTGNVAIIPKSLFDPCYVLTSVLVNEFGASVGDPYHTSALFAVALILLLISVVFVAISKMIILHMERKFRGRK